nr:General transcription factor 3C polypeptide 1 like [Ipomoea batatas]GMD46254.1 General transcription factor 3C polypeptide 1 like [Ipomoea batatas]
MDTIVQAALEEICSRGAAGLPLRELWSELQPALSSHGFTLSPKFKQLLWTNLLDIPDLQFKSNRGAYGPRDDCIRSVVDSERLNLTIFAPEHLLDSFVGIYDVEASDAKVSVQQRRVLELLAIARGNGITQSELTKALGVRGNDIFYILKKLESRGMITRQSTVVRTKEASNEEESKNASVVTTNMVHLYRYAKHLGCHQRLEITKGNKSFMCIDNTNGNAASVDCFSEESTKEDVHIRDFLPALKAICDKLEKAEGKVLVVSDIKWDLGYKGSAGHKSWRNVCHRLKEARVVEEFMAKVDGKVSEKEVSCLRLLKEFSPKHFEPKSRARECDDFDTEQPTKLARRGQITDQLVDLPIEHQAYDMVDAEGSRGLTITEVSRRLGINNKRYYTRLLNGFSRLGMHMQAERPNRGVVYRVWTSRFCLGEASNKTLMDPEEVLKGNAESNSHVMGVEAEDLNPSVSNGCFKDAGKIDITEVEHEGPNNVILDGEGSTTLLSLSKPLNSDPDTSYTVPDAELQIVSTKPLDVVPYETLPLAGLTPSGRRPCRKYPRLTLVAGNAQREQRILKMLQVSSFIR